MYSVANQDFKDFLECKKHYLIVHYGEKIYISRLQISIIPLHSQDPCVQRGHFLLVQTQVKVVCLKAHVLLTQKQALLYTLHKTHLLILVALPVPLMAVP